MFFRHIFAVISLLTDWKMVWLQEKLMSIDAAAKRASGGEIWNYLHIKPNHLSSKGTWERENVYTLPANLFIHYWVNFFCWMKYRHFSKYLNSIQKYFEKHDALHRSLLSQTYCFAHQITSVLEIAFVCVETIPLFIFRSFSTKCVYCQHSQVCVCVGMWYWMFACK